MNRLIMIFLGIIITSILVPQGVNGGSGDINIVFGDVFFNINLPAAPPPIDIMRFFWDNLLVLIVNETDIYFCSFEKCVYVGGG